MNNDEDIVVGIPYELEKNEIEEVCTPGEFPSLMGGEP